MKLQTTYLETKHKLHVGGDIQSAKLQGPQGTRLTYQVIVCQRNSRLALSLWTRVSARSAP